MDHVINFSGYDKYVITLLQQYDAKKTIFVHSDMEKEINFRGNQHRLTLVSAYRNYDNVAAVTEAMGKIAARISGRKDNVVVVNNSFNADAFIENSTKPIEYQKDSRSSVHHPGGIEGILSEKGTKFVAVGRYSPEKQHLMLIDAFAEYNEQNPDSYLIIIGGSGNLYGKTVAHANSKKCSQNIACLWSLANPMPIVKQSDLFVLCSKYEALGLVMLEADAVGVPVICTEMEGPKSLIEGNGGAMVENSKDGLVKGFCEFENGKVKPLSIDYAEYNKTAIKQFESLFN
jgi:CDP-glycerol glycerophosphotransferase